MLLHLFTSLFILIICSLRSFCVLKNAFCKFECFCCIFFEFAWSFLKFTWSFARHFYYFMQTTKMAGKLLQRCNNGSWSKKPILGYAILVGKLASEIAGQWANFDELTWIDKKIKQNSHSFQGLTECALNIFITKNDDWLMCHCF